MNIVEQLLNFFNMDLDNILDEEIKNVKNKFISIKKLKNKRRNRKGAK